MWCAVLCATMQMGVILSILVAMDGTCLIATVQATHWLSLHAECKIKDKRTVTSKEQSVMPGERLPT